MKKTFILLFIACMLVLALLASTGCTEGGGSSGGGSSGGGGDDDEKTPILYVANYNSNPVTFFNAATGAYINGTLANSSFTTGTNPHGVAINP